MIPRFSSLCSRGKGSLDSGALCRVDGGRVAVVEEIRVAQYIFGHRLKECRSNPTLYPISFSSRSNHAVLGKMMPPTRERQQVDILVVR